MVSVVLDAHPLIADAGHIVLLNAVLGRAVLLLQPDGLLRRRDLLPIHLVAILRQPFLLLTDQLLLRLRCQALVLARLSLLLRRACSFGFACCCGGACC